MTRIPRVSQQDLCLRTSQDVRLNMSLEPGFRLLNLTARFIIAALVLQSSGDSSERLSTELGSTSGLPTTSSSSQPVHAPLPHFIHSWSRTGIFARYHIHHTFSLHLRIWCRVTDFTIHLCVNAHWYIYIHSRSKILHSVNNSHLALHTYWYCINLVVIVRINVSVPRFIDQ